MLATPAIHWWPGGLRVSELVSLRWAQVIRRDSGEAQLEAVGKGDKVRQVLIPTRMPGRC
jgi:site-specific recombinase XerC